MVRAPLLGPRVAERRACGKADGSPDPLLVRAFGEVPAKQWEPPEDAAEVVAAIEGFRRALESAPARRGRADGLPTDRACRSALRALPALDEALRAGDRGAAYEALRPIARALRPEAPASGKQAAG